MSGADELAFFHTQYANALQAWKDKKPQEADKICRMLIAEFPCPRFLQVHAWQLRSLCTTQYYDARAHLEECFSILDKFLPEDSMVDKLRTHTEQMIAELDGIWVRKWQALGEKPPTKAELEREEEEEHERDEAEVERKREAEAKVNDATEAISGTEQ